MKKMAYLLSLTLIASLSFFSCDNAEDNEAPTITELKINGVASDGSSAELKDSKVTISFTATDNDKVASIDLKEEGASTSLDNQKIDKSTTPYSFDYNFTKAVKLIITVVDNDDKSVNKIITLSIDPGVNATTTSLSLGAQDDPANGSFLGTTDFAVYKQADAFANQAKVDILYFYDATTTTAYNASLAAPNDEFATGLFTGTSGLANWKTKRNATMLKKVAISASDFSGAVKAVTVKAIYDASTVSGSSKATKLAANDYVAFKTEAGKYGLAKVVAVATGVAGSITLDVKVGK
ncbi:MAG: hypothetical protein L6Q77_13965 [Bacteroidetes bacterium]|nr:hypothetical protein [Bacteroidota bacterium]